MVGFTIYLIVDALMLLGDLGENDGHNGIELTDEDIIVAVMFLYADLILIFIYIVRLFGDDD